MNNRIKVTTENLETARERCKSNDQRRELTVGCETWTFICEGEQSGQMTRWPNGRGAVSFGADSVWGWWDGDLLVSDNKGIPFDENGDIVVPDGMRYDEYGELVPVKV